MAKTVSVPDKAKGIVVERAEEELTELKNYSDVESDAIDEIQNAIQTVNQADSSSVPVGELKLVVERAEEELTELKNYSDVESDAIDEIQNAIQTVKKRI